MRKSILIFISALALTTYSQNGVYSMVNPTIWYKPDSLITKPQEDSISWTDEYTVFSVVRSLNEDSTNECLWSFSEDDTVSYAVLTKGIYASQAGVLLAYNPRNFSRWCIYAYHSGIHADSTKQHAIKIGEEIILPHDTMPADTIHARVEMEEIAYYDRNVPKQASAAFQTWYHAGLCRIHIPFFRYLMEPHFRQVLL